MGRSSLEQYNKHFKRFIGARTLRGYVARSLTRGLCLAPCQSFFDLNDFALTAGDYLHPTLGKTPHDGDRVACQCNRSLTGRTPPSDSECPAIIARHCRAQHVNHATPTTRDRH